MNDEEDKTVAEWEAVFDVCPCDVGSLNIFHDAMVKYNYDSLRVRIYDAAKCSASWRHRALHWARLMIFDIRDSWRAHRAN